MYSEAIFNATFKDKDIEDDSVLIANSIEDLQQTINLLNDASKNNGLKINTSKTKFIIVGVKCLM